MAGGQENSLRGGGAGGVDTPRPLSLGSTEMRTTKSLNRERKRMGVEGMHQLPDGGQQGMAHGPWEPLRAPDPGRRQPTLHLPGQRLPRHPPVPRTPRLPLPSADHRKLGFQAKALGPDSALAFSRHRGAGTSGVVHAGPARGPRCSPSGFVSLRGPPLSGQDIRARPSPPGPGSDSAEVLGLACSGAAWAMSQEGGHAWLAFWL